MGHPLGIVLRDRIVALELQSVTQALLRDITEIGHCRVPIGDGKAWHLIFTEDVVVLNLLCHLDGIGNRLLNNVWVEMVRKQSTHLFFCFDVFRAGIAKTFLIAN